MDLIYTNSEMVDIGVLQNYQFDLELGKDDNNFECSITSTDHCCAEGYFIHIEGTEYGGIIDSIKVDTGTNQVIYSGRTWHGMLSSKIIVPLQSGETSVDGVTIETQTASGESLIDRYLVISGNVISCLQFLIDRLGLSELFVTSGASSIIIDSFQFDRYINGYNGIVKMLDSVNLCLQINFQNDNVVLSVKEKRDYTEDEEFDPSLVELQLTKKAKTVNHLICLGSGELENRTVVHLYADADGNISQEQTQTGLNEYTATFDFPFAESTEELIKNGTENLAELWKTEEIDIDLDDTSDFYNVGDKVGAADNITGISVSGVITKKIVSIKNDLITISYKVG